MILDVSFTELYRKEIWGRPVNKAKTPNKGNKVLIIGGESRFKYFLSCRLKKKKTVAKMGVGMRCGREIAGM